MPPRSCRYTRVPKTIAPNRRKPRVQTAPVYPETTPHIIPPDDNFSANLTVENKRTTPGNYIEEDNVVDDIPRSSHRYLLRSRMCCNTHKLFPSSPLPQANAVVNALTGNVLEYRQLAQDPEKRL